MAILVINKGMDNEAVVGSYCQGILEYQGRVIPASSLPSLERLGVTVLYIA